MAVVMWVVEREGSVGRVWMMRVVMRRGRTGDHGGGSGGLDGGEGGGEGADGWRGGGEGAASPAAV